jgi:hypothetical protein
MPAAKRVTLEIFEKKTNRIVHEFDTNDYKVDRVMSGARINMDTEHYGIRVRKPKGKKK